MKTLLLYISFVLVVAPSCQSDSTTNELPHTKQATAIATDADGLDSVRMKIQQLPDFGISIGVPKYWKVSEFVEQKQKMWAVKCPRTDSTKFAANYIINAVPRQKNVPLRNYGDFLIRRLQEKYDILKVINRDDAPINGVPSTTIDYIFVEQKLNLGGTTTFFFLDDTVVVVNFGAINEPEGEYVSYRGLYARTLPTIRPLK